MILFIRVSPLADYDRSNGLFPIKRRLEDISGLPCLVLNFIEATPRIITELRPRAIVLSGSGTWFRDVNPRDFDTFEECLHTMPEIPRIGFCASHQLIGYSFTHGLRRMDKVVDHCMRPLRPGEPDLSGGSPHALGIFGEKGFLPVHVAAPDPLFEGLSNEPVVYQSHFCEVPELPPEFELIATGANCKIQAMKHKTRILYATQFHPECWIPAFPDGRTILENFFRIAGIISSPDHRLVQPLANYVPPPF
jgi:GMP synthase-like glutamine amidotransferase